MKLVYIWGGLANQMLAYVFARYVEEMTDDDVVLDDTMFSFKDDFPVHNGYELDSIFNVYPKLLSKCISPEIKNEANKAGMYEFLKTNNSGFRLVGDLLHYKSFIRFAYNVDVEIGAGDPYYSIPQHSFCSSVTKFKGNIYYFGNWLNPLWFNAVESLMINELNFPEITDPENKKLREKMTSSNSIGVHIRRVCPYPGLLSELSVDYYNLSINYMKNNIIKPVFFVFSDDIEWAVCNFEALGFDKTDSVVYVDGNTGKNNYKDMQLMTYCKHLIIANSTFSLMASFLNLNPNKVIIKPNEFNAMKLRPYS